ncbi:acyl-CoA thioesterase [Xanthomonas theicola]|uniref:Pectinesterase n=2 Tax=Xanthomonas theicola TaxID=56464 RepID=A0A2S6ZC11_9XANT|nr:acyl-CoA thioesterase [Xanthomonas theicola]QNH27063.1 acyl-CoA thioesterase [Xanthomonas theicola]
MCVIFGKESVDIHPGNKYSSDLLPGKAGRLAALSSDNWDPSAGVALLSADYRVAADGSAPFKSVQAAVNRAVADGGTMRRYISVAPGTYRELLCIPSTAPPITLFGLGNTRSDTLIVFNNANPTPKLVGTPTHPCASNAAAAVTGTSNSATVTVRADAFQARNLTVANDYVEDTYASHNQSAVALAVRGDKALFENVAVLGNQDTLMVSATAAPSLIRAYFKDSLVQGDTDFIFGSGIAVFSHSTIRYDANRLSSRRSGYIFAPSTKPDSIYGFLATDSIFDAIGDVAGNSVYLGRAWDQGVASLSDYVNGTSPNGQVTIRNSTLGAHIRKNAPWAASSTTMRPYCSAGCKYSANRLYEYSNSGAGSTN